MEIRLVTMDARSESKGEMNCLRLWDVRVDCNAHFDQMVVSGFFLVGDGHC